METLDVSLSMQGRISQARDRMLVLTSTEELQLAPLMGKPNSFTPTDRLVFRMLYETLSKESSGIYCTRSDGDMIKLLRDPDLTDVFSCNGSGPFFA